jgi:phospholipid/cholesterol/gamma-HCH transport system permease protein
MPISDASLVEDAPRTAAHPSVIWKVERHDAAAFVQLMGDWVARETGVRNQADIRHILNEAKGATRLSFDTSEVGRWDSALVAFVRDLGLAAADFSIRLDTSGLPETALRLLKLAESGGGVPSDGSIVTRASLLERIGDAALDTWSGLAAMADLLGEAVLRGGVALTGHARTRVVDVFQLMRDAGAGALAIVAIVNGLVGAILAFVGAVQLQRFGAGIYVANLVGIATVREMAAVMTAIVMAGRTGGAYAAHLATMQGNEEIDALKVLGIPTFDFLVLPRLIALIAMMPLLYVYACAVGMLGGFIVGTATLNLTPAAFLEQIRAAVVGEQFLLGLVKSVAFGALIALAGCHIGLRAGRSAADVGHAATTAVVVGIVGVIALDAVFAVCANALRI